MKDNYLQRLYQYLLTVMSATVIILSSCTFTDNGDKQRHERLMQLDDSIMARAKSAPDSIHNGLDNAKDSTTYYEYLLRLANYYWLSEYPERADTLFERTIAFAERHDNNYYKTHHICSSPRINNILAGALAGKAAKSHNFHHAPMATINQYKEAYRLYEHTGNKHNMPKLCANIADAYIQVNDIPAAARYYRRALFLVDSLRLPKKENITLYMGLAQIYLSLHDFSTAQKFYDKTERNYSLMQPSMQAYYLNNLGNFYYYSKNYTKALQTFHRLKRTLISNGMQNNFDMYLCKVNLADVYLNIGQLDKAQMYLNEVEPFFRRTGDQTAIYYCNTIHMGIATRAGNMAEVERVLNHEKPSNDVPYNIVNIRNTYLRQYYEKKGNYRKAYDNLIEDIKYTDSLEHNRSNMRSAEIMARFTADTLQLHHDLAIEHKNADLQRANTKVAIAVAVVAVLIMLIIMWYMHTRKRQLENQVSIMNLKLNNARNRISPHFMFNVLNNKIVNSGEKEATELSELARLIRTNLDMSSQPYMYLDKELDFVNQYIRVERYLLGDDFNFNVDVENGTDTSKVKIPAMFLQILTENAIVHGLKGLERQKDLHISIKREGTTTIISVADNGPGFNARRVLKKGTGLGIISQTIAVCNEHNKHKMRFDIRNRQDENGNVCGCVATLKVPDNITF